MKGPIEPSPGRWNVRVHERELDSGTLTNPTNETTIRAGKKATVLFLGLDETKAYPNPTPMCVAVPTDEGPIPGDQLHGVPTRR